MSFKGRVLAVFILLICIPFCASAKKKKDSAAEIFRYEMECAGAGNEGSYIVKVWVYSSKPKIDTSLIKEKAVHGVLFKGFTGEPGCTSQKPLIKDSSIEHKKQDFFDTFFGAEKVYQKYVSIVSPSPEVVKVDKKEFKIGAIVSVEKDLLRKDLEQAGIVRRLNSGF